MWGWVGWRGGELDEFRERRGRGRRKGGGPCDVKRLRAEAHGVGSDKSCSERVIETALAQVDAASTELEPYIHPGPHAQADQLGGLGWVTETRDPMQIFPYSPLIGRLNPVRPQLSFGWRMALCTGEGYSELFIAARQDSSMAAWWLP